MDKNAYSQIKKVILESYKKHGAQDRSKLFDISIKSFNLTRQQLSDKGSTSYYNNIRAITGSIIKNLIDAGSIQINEHSVKELPQAKRKIVYQKDENDIYDERKQIISNYLSKKYITNKDKGEDKTNRENVLKSILNNKKHNLEIVTKGSIDEARNNVENLFCTRANIDPHGTVVDGETFLNNPIGNKMRESFELYKKFIDNKINRDSYDKQLMELFFEAINTNDSIFFEKFCLDLVKLIYGERVKIANVTGGSMDHGVDGEIVLSDPFDMDDKLVIQAKLSNSGEKVLREFVGSMRFANAQKGLFMVAKDREVQAEKFLQNNINLSKKVKVIGKKELIPLIRKYKIGLVFDKNGISYLDKNYFIIDMNKNEW